MIVFTLLAVGMVTLAVSLVAWPLCFNRVKQGATREAINVALYRDRLAELEAERDSGALAAEQFATAQVELQRDLLENGMSEKASAQGMRRQPWSALAFGALLPTLAAGLYLWLGTPDFIELESAPQHGQAADSGGNMDEAVARLRARLADNPGDLEGWLLLGRSQTVQQRYGAAADAYAQAMTHLGERPEILALYAEALAMAQGRVGGRPEELAKRTLELDPNSHIALWLAGYGASERGDYAGAVVRWERLAGLLPPDSPMLGMVQESVADARERLGTAVPAKGAAARPDPKIRVSVALDNSLSSRLAPEDVLFIYAQDPAGGPMPVAVVRRPATLPTEAVLDQSAVLEPGRHLGDFAALKIVARISRSGAAMARSGDLFGEGRWAPGENKVAVRIDRTVP